MLGNHIRNFQAARESNICLRVLRFEAALTLVFEHLTSHLSWVKLQEITPSFQKFYEWKNLDHLFDHSGFSENEVGEIYSICFYLSDLRLNTDYKTIIW